MKAWMGLVAAMAFVAGAAEAASTPEEAAAAAKPIACESLASAALGLDKATIDSATMKPAAEGAPADCVVVHIGTPNLRSPIMRQLCADREDDPASGKRLRTRVEAQLTG